jgi:hypothetical protein
MAQQSFGWSHSAEVHPCPSCGVIQPEMLFWRPLSQMVGFIVALLGALILFGLSLRPLQHGPLEWIGIAIFMLAALVHFVATFWDANHDCEANLAKARRQEAAGLLLTIEPGNRVGGAPRSWHTWHLPVLVLIALAPFAFVYPLHYLASNPEPPTNPHLTPAVVRGGEEVSYRLQNARASGVGPWRGQPEVRVVNARELGVPDRLKASGSNEEWGSSVSVLRARGSGPLSNGNLQPLIQFTLPEGEDMGGKELRLEVTMPMTYAVLQGTRNFSDATTTVHERLTVRLASSEYADGLRHVYLISTAVAAGLACFGGLCLVVSAGYDLKKPA